MIEIAEILKRKRKPMRIVIKVGTSTLAYATGKLNISRVEKMCKVISDLKNAGNEIVLVSSGAIGMGLGKLNLKKRPEDMPTKQAAAAVGQCELMYVYDKLFSEYNHTVAQILLTGFDVKNPTSYEHFTNTMNRLLDLEALPIVNENDTVAVEEIEIGDNDSLGAIVATAVRADLCIILSDIDGLYSDSPSKNPNARFISEVYEVNEEIVAMAGGKGSSLGTGGMATKLQAAKMCMEAGCDMVIANGKNPDVLYDIVAGKPVGTRFYGKDEVC